MTNYFVHGLQRIILQYTPRSFLKEANVNAPYSHTGGNDTFFLQLKLEDTLIWGQLRYLMEQSLFL